jgi:hypothetical protein
VTSIEPNPSEKPQSWTLPDTWSSFVQCLTSDAVPADLGLSFDATNLFRRLSWQEVVGTPIVTHKRSRSARSDAQLRPWLSQTTCGMAPAVDRRPWPDRHREPRTNKMWSD